MADPESNTTPVSLDVGSGSNVTETSSKYDHLEQMSIRDLVTNMNNEDKSVPFAIEKACKICRPLEVYCSYSFLQLTHKA